MNSSGTVDYPDHAHPPLAPSAPSIATLSMPTHSPTLLQGFNLLGGCTEKLLTIDITI